MNTVLKTSWDFENIDGQVISPSNLEWEENLDGIGELSFDIPVKDESLLTFTEYKKVTLEKILDGEDTVLSYWVVDEVKYDFRTANVICKEEKEWLKHKLLYTAKNWTTTDFKTSINEVLAEVNARKSSLEDDIVLESTLSVNITKEFNKGGTVYDMLEEIVKLIGAEWTMQRNKIIIKTTLGEDRTTGEGFFEIISSIYSPNENNISKAEYKKSSKELATAILGKGKTSYSDQSETIAGLPRIEKFKSFNEGDIVAQTLEELTLSKYPQRIIQAETLPEMVEVSGTVSPISVSVGDTLALRVEWDNEALDIQDSVRVLKKSVKMKNGVPAVSFDISNIKRKRTDAVSFFSGIAKDIQKLQTST